MKGEEGGVGRGEVGVGVLDAGGCVVFALGRGGVSFSRFFDIFGGWLGGWGVGGRGRYFAFTRISRVLFRFSRSAFKVFRLFRDSSWWPRAFER